MYDLRRGSPSEGRKLEILLDLEEGPRRGLFIRRGSRFIEVRDEHVEQVADAVAVLGRNGHDFCEAEPVELARISFEAWAGGTLLRFRASGQPRGPMRIARPLLRLVLKRQFTAYCAKLKQLLEAQSG